VNPQFNQFTRLALQTCATAPLTRTYTTDGYFDFGYDIKAKGMGGAGVTFPQDSLATAANPAGGAWLDNHFDLGVTHFQPDRSAAFGANAFDGKGKAHFIIPEAGFRQALTSDLSLGVAAYGNGSMNTDYGVTHAGVDLSQLFLAPALAYKITENHAVGRSPILARQSFKAYGLRNFGLADLGRDQSAGGGARIGYTGKLADWLMSGATCQSRIFTAPFSKYDQLFAEHGSCDVRQNVAFGLAIKPIKSLTFAVAVEEIFSVKSNRSGMTCHDPGWATQWELSAFYAHAFGAAANADLSLDQNSVGQALGWKLFRP
jgi:long-chain fatty acid transport protein